MTQTTMNPREEAGAKAAAIFGNGFHCAESVAVAVLETLGENPAEATAHATAFGGGVGETYEEACGALSGALIAIGHLYGRRNPGGDWALPAELGAEIREHFIEDHQSTRCLSLRQRFGEENQMAECRKIVATVANRLTALVLESVADDGAACPEGSPGSAAKPLEAPCGCVCTN